MKKLLRVLTISLISTIWWPLRPAAAFNPITDFKENVQWTFGKAAEVGTAVKLAGAGDMKPGDTSTSILAGIADYRWFSFAVGGTRVNQSDANFTDTAKLGLKLTSFFDWFKNPPTPEMAFLRNLNVGPSYAISMFSSPHAGTLFLDVNYRFGGSSAPPTTVAP
jgi:hypothetical protein